MNQFNVRVYQCEEDSDEYVYSGRCSWEEANRRALEISKCGFALVEVVAHKYPEIPIRVVQYRDGVRKVISVADVMLAESESRLVAGRKAS